MLDEYSIDWLFDRDAMHQFCPLVTYIWGVGVGLFVTGPIIALLRHVVGAFV